MPYRLGVDLGTTYTAVAVASGSAEPAMVGLGNRAMQIPSVLFLDHDDEFVIGESAERRGAVEPVRIVREFKRRFGDTVPIRVDGRPYPAHELTSVLLRSVIALTAQQQGEPPGSIVLTHPANWGRYKLDLFEEVAEPAGLSDVSFCSEPVAAAIQYAAKSRVRLGDRLAVYDLGGGTFDVCILGKAVDGFELLGTPRGIDRLGGTDFDDVVLSHVVAALERRGIRLDPDDPELEGLDRLRRDCVDAKEALSTELDSAVRVVLGGSETVVRITRPEFEAAIRSRLRSTVEATRLALRSAGVEATALQAIVLIGGSSRIPLVAELLQREFAVPLGVDTHPKHDVALGAARLGAVLHHPTAGAPPLATRRQLPPATADPDYTAAVALQKSGRWEDAAALFELLARRYPTDHAVLDRLGVIRRRLALGSPQPPPPDPARRVQQAPSGPARSERARSEPARSERARSEPAPSQPAPSKAPRPDEPAPEPPRPEPAVRPDAVEPAGPVDRRRWWPVLIGVVVVAVAAVSWWFVRAADNQRAQPPSQSAGQPVGTPNLTDQQAPGVATVRGSRATDGRTITFAWSYSAAAGDDSYQLRWTPDRKGLPPTSSHPRVAVSSRDRTCLSVRVHRADGQVNSAWSSATCVS